MFTHSVMINKDPPHPDVLVLTTTVTESVTGEARTQIAAFCGDTHTWLPCGSGVLFRLTAEELAAAVESAGGGPAWKPPEGLRIHMEGQARDIAALSDPNSSPEQLRGALRVKEPNEPTPGA